MSNHKIFIILYKKDVLFKYSIFSEIIRIIYFSNLCFSNVFQTLTIIPNLIRIKILTKSEEIKTYYYLFLFAASTILYAIFNISTIIADCESMKQFDLYKSILIYIFILTTWILQELFLLRILWHYTIYINLPETDQGRQHHWLFLFRVKSGTYKTKRGGMYKNTSKLSLNWIPLLHVYTFQTCKNGQ